MTALGGWRLRLLGEFVLERDGRIVDRFGTRKEELVLAYLALASHTALVREAVASEFWPFESPSTARKNLSYNLSILRSRFAALGFASLFSAGRSTARLSDTLRVDVEEFSELMLTASVAPAGTHRIELLERALAMYGGGLLPTYTHPWLEPHQARFGAMYAQAVSLISAAMQPGAAEVAVMGQLPSSTWRSAGLLRTAPPSPWPSAGAQDQAPALLRTGRDVGFADAPPGPDTDTPPSQSDSTLMALAHNAESGLRGEDWARWVAQLEPYIAALDASITANGKPQPASDECLIRALTWRYWQRTGMASHGYFRLHHLLATARDLQAPVRAKALYAAGSLAYFAGETERAVDHLQESIQMWRHVDDPRGLLGSLMNLGLAHHRLGALSTARDCYGQALGIARAIGDDVGAGLALFNAALAALDEQDTSRARSVLEERRALCPRDLPSAALAGVDALLASADLIDGRIADADAHARAALASALAVGNFGLASHAHRLLGGCACRTGDWAAAQDAFEQAVAEGRRANCYRETGAALGYLAISHHMQGRHEVAETKMFQALGLLKASGDVLEAERFKADVKRLIPNETIAQALTTG